MTPGKSSLQSNFVNSFTGTLPLPFVHILSMAVVGASYVAQQ